jgi:hypothetical protein
MNAAELEAKYLDRCTRRGSLLVFEAEVAILILQDCFESRLPFGGFEAFRLFEDGKVQPGMEYSNTYYWWHQKVSDYLELDTLHDAIALIRMGAANGFGWFELYIGDPDTDDSLFFRILMPADSGV